MSDSAENDAPLRCSSCNETSEGSTYLAFIHAHAECHFPPGVCFICGKPRQPGSEWCDDHTERTEGGEE